MLISVLGPRPPPRRGPCALLGGSQTTNWPTFGRRAILKLTISKCKIDTKKKLRTSGNQRIAFLCFLLAFVMLGGQGQYVIMLSGQDQYLNIWGGPGPYVIMLGCQGQYVIRPIRRPGWTLPPACGCGASGIIEFEIDAFGFSTSARAFVASQITSSKPKGQLEGQYESLAEGRAWRWISMWIWR